MKMGDKIKMDIKHTENTILNLFHNASTELKFIYVVCFHGQKTTVFKQVFRLSDEEANEEILILSGPTVNFRILNQKLTYAYV